MTSVDLEYLRQAILRKDVDTIFDVMANHPNSFIIAPILEANPRINPNDMESLEKNIKMYSSRFLCMVILYAFQLFDDSRTEEICDLAYKFIIRHYSSEWEVFGLAIYYLGKASDTRAEVVFRHIVEQVSKQDNTDMKIQLVYETIYKTRTPSWSRWMYDILLDPSPTWINNKEMVWLPRSTWIHRCIEHIEVISLLYKYIRLSPNELITDLYYLAVNRYYDKQSLLLSFEYRGVCTSLENSFKVFNDPKMMHHYKETYNSYLTDEDIVRMKNLETLYREYVLEDVERKRIASEILPITKEIVQYVIFSYIKLRD
jgi:hypothetical protein